MARIYSLEAGNTLNAHDAFLKKLTKRGAETVVLPEESNVTIVFCPITSRYETDLNFALSKLQATEGQKVILVAMHPTCNPDYTTPNNRELDRPVTLAVNCLFHEKMGLLKCPQNKTAYKRVRKELGLKWKLFKKTAKPN